MRFRYRMQDNKHTVQARDDQGNWGETKVYASQGEAVRVARAGDVANAKTIGDIEKALASAKKAKPEIKPSDLPGETVTSGTAEDAGDKGRAVDEPPSHDEAPDPHDLTLIPGVGEATAEKLRENGITTLRMLGRVSPSRAAELGIRQDWIDEAKRLTS